MIIEAIIVMIIIPSIKIGNNIKSGHVEKKKQIVIVIIIIIIMVIIMKRQNQKTVIIPVNKNKIYSTYAMFSEAFGRQCLHFQVYTINPMT